MRTFNVLNLGAGVQSSRIFLASCRGELLKFDAAVFADTQWEPKGVYGTLAFLKAEGAKAGVPVVQDTKGDLRADAVASKRLGRSSTGNRFAAVADVRAQFGRIARENQTTMHQGVQDRGR